MRTPHLSSIVAIAAGLAAGTFIGFLDVQATEVQGPLLLFMISAFVVSMVFGESPIIIGIAVFLGLPLGHIVSRMIGRGGENADVQFGMLVAAVPILIASFAGKGVNALLQRASASLLTDHPRAAYQSFVLAIVGSAAVGTPLVYATFVVRGQINAWWVACIWQILTALAWTVLLPIVLRLQRRLRSEWMVMGEIGAHAAVVVLIAIAHPLVLDLICRLLAIGMTTAGPHTTLAWTLAAYLPLDAITYAGIRLVTITSDAESRAREAMVREAAVRGELAVAQLAGLRAQLRPHFLFNALNAATVLARRGDAETTARMLEGLAGLLRHVLRSSPDDARHMVPLRDEFAFVREYLEISRQRFEGRLVYSLNLPDDLADELVPHLLLQPLVENAIEHGIGGKLSASTVHVSVSRVDGRIRITVEDDGPGPPTAGDSTAGVGLANTRRRLSVLYGESASIELTAGHPSGAVATIVMPVHKPTSPNG